MIVDMSSPVLTIECERCRKRRPCQRTLDCFAREGWHCAACQTDEGEKMLVRLRIPSELRCGNCGGLGALRRGDHRDVCPMCDGDGRLRESCAQCRGSGGVFVSRWPGWLLLSPSAFIRCGVCRGFGVLKHRKMEAHPRPRPHVVAP